jgi:hypothetical protein
VIQGAAIYEGFVAAGILKMDRVQIESLTLNAWIILTSWVRFLCTTRENSNHLSEQAIKRGVYQVLVLEAGFVTEQARDRGQCVVRGVLRAAGPGPRRREINRSVEIPQEPVMPIAQLISPQALDARKEQPGLVILDCRFALEDPDYGQRSYAEGHIAGASFADLERDLSGKVVKGVTGRHPLPEPAALIERLQAWGINSRQRRGFV